MFLLINFLLIKYDWVKLDWVNYYGREGGKITCKKPTKVATPHPSLLESGSTRINWTGSMTRKRRALVPSRTDTVQAIKSELSLNKKKKKRKNFKYKDFFDIQKGPITGNRNNLQNSEIWSNVLRSRTSETLIQFWARTSGSWVSSWPVIARVRRRISRNTRIARRALSTWVISINTISIKISYIQKKLGRRCHTSPHGSLLVNSIPVIGVPVGGNKMDESCSRYSTLNNIKSIIHYNYNQ